MTVAPAAPAAGAAAAEVGLLGLALLALLVWAIAYGLRGAWVYTIGWAIEQLAHLLRHIPLGVGVYLESQLIAVNATVVNVFVHVINGSDELVGHLFHWMGTVFAWSVGETVALTRDTLRWAEHLQNVHLPNYVKWAIRAAVPPWLIYSIARKAITAELPHLRRVVHTATHTVEVEVTKLPAALGREVKADHRHIARLAAVVAAIAGALTWPHGLTVPLPAKLWGGLTKRLARAERRLRRLEALLGVTGMAVAMANVLGIANPRCLTKGPLGKLSRALCGLGGAALNDLLALLVDAFVLGDPCDTMTLMVKGAHLLDTPIADATSALDAAFGRCGYDLAAPLAVPKPAPPANAQLTLTGA